MGSYVPVTPEERRAMLERIGLPSVEALYADVPEGVLLKEPPVFTGGFSELEVRRHMERLAEQNRVFSTILRGAGAYDHYIPAIVRAIPSKEAFLTAYTPYQAEISQGLLQSIFEYQTMICRLTGMDVANASVYDGASAAAEACAMVRERRRTVTLVSACAHPDVIATIRTYCWGSNHEMRLIPEKDGVTDLDALRGALDDQVSGVYLASPNFLGGIEDVSAAAEICHAAGAKLIVGANPIALALFKTPGEAGADVVRGRWTAPGHAAELRRAVCGLHGDTHRADAQAPRPHRGPDHRCGRKARLRADASGARAAHPPRKGGQQHLLQSGAVRAHGRRATWARWARRACAKWPASAMTRRITSLISWPPSACPGARRARSSTSSPRSVRAARRRCW